MSQMIYLSKDENISNWMRREITSKRGPRYRLTHISEDMKVPYQQLYNFMRGKNVTSEFYDKFFILYLQKWIY